MEFVNFVPKNESPSVIKVIGVGGGGGNAVNHMYKEGIHNVSFAVMNSDMQDLNSSPVPIKLQLGETLTKGLGCGSDPEIGKQAAEESEEKIRELLSDGTMMVFITAGMGGGTGTGAAPVVARIAKDMGILTVGIVTIPFKMEREHRINQALQGVIEMRKYVDSLLIINNELMVKLYEDMTIKEAFAQANEVLTQAAKGIAEMITIKAAQINIDFNDVKTIMKDSGVAIMNSGIGEGPDRLIQAIEEALTTPLLKSNDIKNASRLLIYVYTSEEHDMRMSEHGKMTEFIDQIGKEKDIHVIWGQTWDNNLEESMKVTIVATGFELSDMTDINVDSIREDYYGKGARKVVEKPVISPTEVKQEPETVEEQPTEPAENEVLEEIGFDEWSDNDNFDDIDTPAYKR